MNHSTSVLVIGGGAIGGACAYYLSKAGAKVTLIDKSLIGHGSSYGNAGWIVPCHAMPLPQPGALRQAAKWMLRPDSPLYVKPRLSWEMARWFYRFLRSANPRHLNYAAPILIDFAKQSFRLFEELAQLNDFGFEKRGLLYMCNSQAGLEHVMHEAEIASACGITGRQMSEGDLRAFQPCITGPVVGGHYFQTEAHAEPLSVVQSLVCRAEQSGARILPNTEVFDIETDARHRITGVRTTRGRLSADHYVLATGAWAPVLARKLKLNVPIQAGKGYALTVEPFDPAPSVPMLLVEKKVAITPRIGSIRLAGTMELAGLDESITPTRVDAIVRGARAFVNLPPGELKVSETWRGLRPCTPDGLPIISRSDRYNNLVLAAGHAMLGLTLATGTGRIVSDLITGGSPLVDPHPFRSSRF